MAADSGTGVGPRIVKPPKPTITSRSGSEPKARQYYQPPAISPASISVLLNMGIVAPAIARQLASAGLKYSVADTMQTAGAGRGPAANFSPYTNTINYNPRHARTAESFRGTIGDEFVHAASANIPGLSNDPRYQYVYGAQQFAMGNRNLAAIRALVNTSLRPQFFALSEGLAHRGEAYDVPEWGDVIRNAVLGR